MSKIFANGASVLFFALASCIRISAVWKRSESPESHQQAHDTDADLFDGDIMRYPQINETSSSQQEAASIADNYHWKNGIVPLHISLDFNRTTRAFIKNVTKELEEFTCVRFPYDQNEEDFVDIVKAYGGACRSDVGRRGGRQKVHLTEACITRNEILHELMHAIGFFHEHNRPDRDNYVEILWANIPERKIRQFTKYDENNVSCSFTRYDFLSVTHYPSKAYPNKEVIRPINPPTAVIKADGLSDLDKLRVNCVYRCPGYENCERFRDPVSNTCNYQLIAGTPTPTTTIIPTTITTPATSTTTRTASTTTTRTTTQPTVTNNGHYQLIADTKPRYIFSHNNYGLMNYPPNWNCSWTIRGENGNEVEILFETFDLQYSLGCSKDFVKIYYKIPIIETDRWGLYCGKVRHVLSLSKVDGTVKYVQKDVKNWTIDVNLNSRVALQRNNLYFAWYTVLHIRFGTDKSEGDKGFKLIYYSEATSGGFSACGSTLVASETAKYFVSHAQYPNDYPYYYVCNWTVTASSGKQLVAVVRYFSLEPSTNCTYDFLEIFNGANLTGAKIGRYCGDYYEIPRFFRNPTGSFSFYFKTDNGVQRAGFWIMYFEE